MYRLEEDGWKFLVFKNEDNWWIVREVKSRKDICWMTIVIGESYMYHIEDGPVLEGLEEFKKYVVSAARDHEI